MNIWKKVKLFFAYLFAGMHAADKNLTSGEKDTGMDEAGIERRQESDSVYAQLLRGEVTQEVKEVRHEMYYAERKSHEYEYGGGGRAVKKSQSMFSYQDVENGDGYKLVLIQPNIKVQLSLYDYGIVPVDDGVYYDDTKDTDPDGITASMKVLKFKYDFTPKFKLENYVDKVVLRDAPDGTRYADLYFPTGYDTVNRIDRQFSNELDRVMDGDRRSDILHFEELSFATCKASLVVENLEYVLNEFVFKEAFSYAGYRVCRYTCKTVVDGRDLLNEVYDERTAKLIEEKAPRKETKIDLTTAVEIVQRENYDYDTAEELMNEVANAEG